MRLEEFEAGVFKPTQEEVDEATQKGPEAVDALFAKYNDATGRLRGQRGDKAISDFSKFAEENSGKVIDPAKEMFE